MIKYNKIKVKNYRKYWNSLWNSLKMVERGWGIMPRVVFL